MAHLTGLCGGDPSQSNETYERMLQLEIDHKQFLEMKRSYFPRWKAEVAGIHTDDENVAFSSTDQPLEKDHGGSGKRTKLAKHKANKTPDSKSEDGDESDVETSQADLESMIQLLRENVQRKAAKAKSAKHNQLLNDSADDGMAEDTDDRYQQAIQRILSQQGPAAFNHKSSTKRNRNAYESGDEAMDLQSQRVIKTPSSRAGREMISLKQNQSTKRQRKTAFSDDEDTDEYEENPFFTARVSRTAQRNMEPKTTAKTKAKHVSCNQSDMEENAHYSQNGASEKDSQGDSQTSFQQAKRSKLPNAKGLPAWDHMTKEPFGYSPAHIKPASSKTKDQKGIGNDDGNGKHEAKATVNAQPAVTTNGNAPADNGVVEEAMDGLSLEGDGPEAFSSTGYSGDSDMEDSDGDEQIGDLEDEFEENSFYASDSDE